MQNNELVPAHILMLPLPLNYTRPSLQAQGRLSGRNSLKPAHNAASLSISQVVTVFDLAADPCRDRGRHNAKP